MANGLVKIIAVPNANTPNGGGENLGNVRDVIQTACAHNNGYKYIGDYNGLADLIDHIRTILAAETWTNAVGQNVTGGALDTLEIVAHGSDKSCNSLWDDTIPYFSDALMHTTLSDSVNIYLSGCNTGNTREGGNTKSLAHLLADAMKFNNATFPYHVTVHGSRGYMIGTGTNMMGNEKTIRSFSDGIWPFSTDHPPYHGSVDANGNTCWQAWKNGTW